MNKKRLLTGLTAGTLLVTMLAGCGGAASDGAAAGGSAATDGSNKITMVLSQRDEWLSDLDTAAGEAATAHGLEMNSLDALSDTSKQIQYVESARNNGEKAIIVNLVDPNIAPDIVEAAGDMKVVFVNRVPEDMAILNENVVYVGSDESTSGRFQGEWLANHFKAAGKTDIKYIMINGIMGQTSTTNRTLSVLKALSDGGITATEATAPLACDYDRPKAMTQIAPLLNTVTYDCIISNNDAMALGAIEAMESAGIDPATIPIVGIDATADGRQAVKDGKMSMTVFQNAKGQGECAMLAAINMLEGKPLNDGMEYKLDTANPNIVWVPFEPITPENVAEYDAK